MGLDRFSSVSITHMRKFDFLFICVTEHIPNILIYFTHLWSVHTALILDTLNAEITGISTAHAYKNQTPRNNEAKIEKHFLFVSHQFTFESKKQRQ